MDKLLWLLIMVPVSALLTGIGIFTLRRQKPMWFWSGTEVRAEEIADVPAYNRANGVMWIAYSAVFWLSTLLGLFDMRAAGRRFLGFPEERAERDRIRDHFA